LIPTARTLGLLVNPSNPGLADATAVGVQSAAQGFGLEIRVFKADADFQLEGLFGGLNQLRIGGLVIGGDPFFTARQEHLAELANRYAIPTVYEDHEFTQAGGLVSYGGSLVEAYRLTGVYAARILKGERPADLPVQQSTKVELYINLKTAKSLGITVPITLLGRADEVIE
jgi:putative ABC transport system substrate-binding protein